MKILFAASEAAPFLKSGGLGDVLEALPPALAATRGTEVAVILPLYGKIKNDVSLGLSFVTSFTMSSPLSESYVGIFTKKQGRVTYYFIDNEYYFCRGGAPYGHGDDGARYAFFSNAILASLPHIDYYPDIIHLNDWQTATLPVYLKAFYAHLSAYQSIRTVFTIHNIEYQGYMPQSFPAEAMGLPYEYHDVMRYGDCANFMKAAIELSDRVTTVSRTYARELEYAYFSHGLDPIIRKNKEKLSGIVNGINTKLFDPATDKALPAHFSCEDLSGKAICKQELQKELGLPVRADVPVIAMISRLVSHKGLELVECVLEDILQRDVQLIVLGTGEGKYEELFRFAEYTHPDKMKAEIRFDSALASRIYAGCDLFLMPSKSEPCGLSQLIAMRYGAIPIVRETGGLFDTVPALDVENLTGRGFTFQSYNAHHMLDAIDRAIAFYGDKEKLACLKKQLLSLDLSWKVSAKEYLTIYKSLLT